MRDTNHFHTILVTYSYCAFPVTLSPAAQKRLETHVRNRKAGKNVVLMQGYHIH